MQENEYEVIILGRGPAGLQAAIHASRSKVKALVLGKPNASSIYNSHIENYCCLNNVAGNDLLSVGESQASESGAVFLEKDCVETAVEDATIRIKTEDGSEYISRALVFALGVSRKKLDISGETAFKGKGVSYCVDCDAGFYKNKPVAVIGDGSAAISGSLLMSDYTNEVHLITRRQLNADQEKQKLAKAGVMIHENRDVKKIIGDAAVTGISLDDGTSLSVGGVFIELGAKGVSELAGTLGIMMDESLKYIDVNKKQETNIPGVYAAGDICGPPWQVAKAVGEGCVAGLEAAKYAKKFRD